MLISQDERFAFDVAGYLHLRGALTPHEVATLSGWVSEAEKTVVADLNADYPDGMKQQLNRPVSRIFDADPRFACLLDHPVVVPYLTEFLGPDYRHIDNDLYYTYPGYAGGHWHRGVSAHPTGHVVGGKFICPMVKVFYCLSDVGRAAGEFVVIPGSHKASFKVDYEGRVDLPAQRLFDDVKAGDIILFNEALLHNGRPNPSQKTRKTLIVNFGREDAGVWKGYRPKSTTLAASTPAQRAILSNANPAFWKEPQLNAQTNPPTKALSDAQVAQYQRDGYVVVPDLIAPDTAIEWKAKLQQRLADEGLLGNIPSGVRVWMSDNTDAYSAAQLQSPSVLQILQQLIGPNVEFLSFKAVFKNAKTAFNSPWHQDWAYWGGSPKLSIWIALDEATPENGCLQLVPGSHHSALEMKEVEDGKGFVRRISEDQVAGMPIATAPVPRGAGIFFHDLTLHASCPNINGQDRWSVIPTYRDAAQQDSSTVWPTARLLSGSSVNV